MQIIHEAKETIIEEGRFGLGKFTANYVKTFALYPADSPNFGRVNERITRNGIIVGDGCYPASGPYFEKRLRQAGFTGEIKS